MEKRERKKKEKLDDTSVGEQYELGCSVVFG